MNDALDPRDDLTDRLAALGRHPVDPATQSDHLTRIAGVRPATGLRGAFASRAKIGAAIIGGFLIGTTGLASAGAMGPLQNISANVVETVTPLTPPHHGNATSDAAKAKHAHKTADAADTEGTDSGTKAEKYWDATDCPNKGDATNRGQYLKQIRESGDDAAYKKAQQSDCGKAVAAHDAGTNADRSADDQGTDTNTNIDTGKKADATNGSDHGKSADHAATKGGKSGDHSQATTTGEKPAETPNSANAAPEATDHPTDSTDSTGTPTVVVPEVQK
jgi:hypothetical protein